MKYARLFRSCILLMMAIAIVALSVITFTEALLTGHVMVAGGIAALTLCSLSSWRHMEARLCVANDFGALANSTLIHDCMQDFRLDLAPFFDGILLDVGEKTSDGGLVRTLRPGQVVTFTQYFNPPTPYQPKNVGGYVAPAYNAGTPITMTCPGDPWANSFNLTPDEFRVLTGGPRINAAYDSLRKKINDGLFYGLKLKIIQDALANITIANFPYNFVSASGTFSRSTEVDLDTKIFKRSLNDPSATVILHPDAYGEWAKDHNIVLSYTGQDQKGRLMQGGVQSMISPNLTFWRTNVPLPTDAARGVAFMKSGLAGIFRIPDEPGLGTAPTTGSDTFNSLATVVDDESQIAFLVRTWKNWQTGAIQMDVAIIYTIAPFQNKCLERIIATSES